MLKAGLAAFGLYACMTTYCARYLTDGMVPPQALAGMLDDGDDEPLNALLEVGLIEERPCGFHYLPEYLRGNWTREKVEAERAATARRKREYAERQSAKKRKNRKAA